MRKAEEIQLMNEMRLHLSERGVLNFRANVGKVKTADGRWFDTGLPKGHSDIYGILPGGRTIYVEAKTPDEYAKLMSRISRDKMTQHDKDQCNFIDRVIEQGAVAGFCSTLEDVDKLIKTA